MPEIGLKLLKFEEKKDKNDLYIIFPIPEIGLHLSLHGTSENNIHMHIRDGIGLGIDEDIPQPDNIYANVEEWLEDIARFLYWPGQDSILLVAPTPTMSELNKWGISFSKGEIRIDFSRLLLEYSEYFDRYAYFVRTKQLLAQVSQLVQQDATAFDITEEKLVTFHKFGEVCVMLGYKVDNLQDQLKETKIWKNLCLPMDRALSCAEKKWPHAFEKWETKDVQALEKFYSNRLDSMLRSIGKRLKKLVDKKLPN